MLVDLGFRWRGWMCWSPPAWLRPVPPEALSLAGTALARYRTLAATYDLRGWPATCDVQDWRESLYVLDLLDRHLPRDLPAGRALDVGSKNGAYLPGLAAAVPRGWDAVEIDAHRRYLWGATRRAHGEAKAAALPGCRFVAGDVREQSGPWAVVTWFLPFLSPAPHAAWGLPARLLDPGGALDHVLAELAPGGVLFVVNQGAAEAAVQRRMLAERAVPFDDLGRIDSPLSPFRQPRYGLVARRPVSSGR